MFEDLIKRFAESYSELKKTHYGSSAETEIVTHKIPELLYEELGLSEADYQIRGSVGNGRWADVPWVCIMHRGVTETTQNGYYIAALFSSDMKRIFVTVGLGWTQFQEKYGTKSGKEKIKAFAFKLAQSLPAEPNETQGVIDLDATTQRSQGYEYSNITSIQLDIASLKHEHFINSLKTMLSHYEFLRNEFGSDIFYDSFDDMDEPQKDSEEFKRTVKKLSSSINKEAALKNLVSIAELEPPARKKTLTSHIIRNRAFADYVKERANFICEICGRKPFPKRNGQPYAEADHIEMLGEVGKDHPDNMRCLCPQCHRVITYGSEAEISKLGKEQSLK